MSAPYLNVPEPPPPSDAAKVMFAIAARLDTCPRGMPRNVHPLPTSASVIARLGEVADRIRELAENGDTRDADEFDGALADLLAAVERMEGLA